MHPRLQRLGAQTARFFHTGLEGTRRFAYHAAREVPRVARIVDAEVLQPLSRTAKVVGSVTDAGHLGNSGLKDAASSFSRGMESYDALRQTVDLTPKDLLQRRYERLRAYGRFSDTKEH